MIYWMSYKFHNFSQNLTLDQVSSSEDEYRGYRKNHLQDTFWSL